MELIGAVMAGSGPNMEQFELFFQRADLDRDGRISGAEAVSFFQASNLPQTVLARIWMHADQACTGSLGRPEFFNALKLVTVAQSKRDLTPDIVKAALYGPASAKIPAPQINLAAVPAPPANPVPSEAPPRMGPIAPTPSQNPGFRGQIPLSSSNISQLYGPSQVNQTLRPPLPQFSSNAFPQPQGTVVAPALPSTSSANNWLGGRTSGVLTAVSQAPDQGISQSMPLVSAKPQVSQPSPLLPAVKDTRPSTGSGNGFTSDAMLGGALFTANQSVPKQIPTQAANNPEPFELLTISLPRQEVGNQVHPNQRSAAPNQQVSSQITSSVETSGVPVGVGSSAPNPPQPSWPKMTPAGIQKYTKVFVDVDTDKDGKITGEQARNLFLSWRLPREVLKQVWELSDQDNDSMLSLREFCIALYLMERYREGCTLPQALPSNVLLDEALLSLTSQPSTAYGNAAWGPSAGVRPQQGFPGARPVTSTAGARPPLLSMSPQVGSAAQYNQQKARVPQMESSSANLVSNGDYNSADTMLEDPAESEEKLEEKEKLILDSKEKLEFFRTKMQDLVLYKSRCDNRLNEITERAIVDEREAELLGKKYVEKYKQVAESASKLTLEEAAYREIQERKMELQQALVRMEQGGSADGILQLRADRIQSDLEELMKGLSDRCKKHGIYIKSAAIIELPVGWQPGVPAISSVWNEDWDKFEDEGFAFDVFVSSKSKPTSVEQEKYSANGSSAPDLMSHDDAISEKSDSNEHVFESESADAHSEDESVKHPSQSRVERDAFKSPSREYPDNHLKMSPEADEGTHGFDEQGWGTFDNNDDIDSVWGFDAGNSKESPREKHGQKYLFGSSEYGDSPRRSDSPRTSTFQKKSTFAFEDSVPSSSPFSRASNSLPRYGMGSSGQIFDNSSRFDSFSMSDHTFSPRKETFSRFDSMGSNRGFDQNHGGLTRFDSMNSTTGYNHGQRFSSFDDNDPFGSSGPFRVSSEIQSPRKDSDKWGPF